MVFIRSDIYDLPQFSERDKFRGDELRIDWSADALIDLLVARARVSASDAISADDLFSGLFEAHVDFQKTEAFLVSRTLMRPRDLIQFANLCRDTAAKNGHPYVSSGDMLEAERQYSVWKVQDLAGEYLVNYPFLNELFVLFQNSGYLLTSSELERRLQKLADVLRRRYRRFADVFTCRSVTELLYGIGFLGVRRGPGFEYIYDGNRPLDVDDDELCVHPCFRQALRTVVAGEGSRFVPFTIGGARAAWLGPAEVAFRGSREQLILDAVEAACHRAERILASAQMAPELLAGLLTWTHDALADTRERRDRFEGLEEALVHGNETVRMLRQLSARLVEIADGDYELEWTASRVVRIALGLEDEMDGLLPGPPRPGELSP